ncbi:vesicle transport protein SFT2B-like [Cyprinodon tularosa]|uniref:Vesicle transport protein n=1 Tax=Cyprinodon variegatus TaxID=28743 RepID=A0A3Q2FED4_CYPVA|nr:PREDICTED: vesicle transport protein SFT2B-like [Cyprinodon variegatus]XP_038131700.1 vesicle transport protein SFT2B-like [Cyprinodon tularosa]
MDKLKSVLSGEESRRDDRSVLQSVNEASTLGWGTRIKGFIACFVVGGACTVLGVCMLFLPRIGLTLFIVFYTFGNICALCSTMFLMGPLKQLKRMCDKTRALATAIMITCLVLTLCAAFWWKNFGLALLFCILQILSFSWYSLSYIPCAREMIMKGVSICIK